MLSLDEIRTKKGQSLKELITENNRTVCYRIDHKYLKHSLLKIAKKALETGDFSLLPIAKTSKKIKDGVNKLLRELGKKEI